MIEVEAGVFFRSVKYPLWHYDTTNLRLLNASQAALEAYGYTHDELVGLTILDLFATHERPAFLSFYDQPERERVDRVWTHQTRDGRPLLVELFEIQYGEADTAGRVIMASDVSERERLRAERDELLASYERLAAASQEHHWDWDLAHGTYYRSPGLLAALGYSEKEVTRTADWWETRIHPDQRAAVVASMKRAIELRQPRWTAEYRFMRANGQYIHVYDRGILTLDAEGDPARMAGSMVDVTDRRAAEIERDRFISLSPEPKLVLDEQGNVRRMNESASALLGCDAEGSVGVPFRKWIDPSEAHRFEDLCTLIRFDEVRRDMTVPMLTSAGERRDVQWNLSGYLPTGQIFLTGRDITAELIERRRAMLIDTAMQNSHDVVIISERFPNSDRPLRIVYVNQVLQDLLGFQPSEVLGSSPLRFHDTDQSQALLASITDRLRAGETVREELLMRHRNGSDIWVEANIHPIVSESGDVTHYVTVGRDVTQQRRDREQIEESNHQLNRMLERIDDGFCALDREFRFTYVNSRAQKFLRQSLPELMGKPIWDAIPTLKSSEFFRPLMDAFHMQRPAFIEGTSRRFQRQYDLRVYPSGDGLSLFMTDVTERNRIQHELDQTHELLQDILDRSLDIIAAHDRDGRFVTINPACKAIWGYDPEELLGNPYFDILVEEDAEIARQLQPEENLAIRSFENRIRHKDGHVVEMVWSATRSAEHNLTVSIGRDMTEANIIKRDLERAREESDRLAYEAQTASRTQTAFLQTVSHELRTPLNGVLGMAELLGSTSLNERQVEYVRVLSESGGLLLGVLNNILDLTRLEAGNIRVDLKPLALRECIESTISDFEDVAHRKGISIRLISDVRDRVRVEGDRLRIRQIVGNLLDNAIKFSSSGEITVNLSTVDLGDDLLDVTVEVADRGIGISAEFHELIFDRFYQVDMSTTRAYGGSGLGLAIAKRLAELMVGTLSVQSEVGKGSVFRLTVPLRVPVERERASATLQLKPTDWGDRPPVLIVEDIAVNIDVLTHWLNLFGIPYETVTNGTAAVAQLDRSTYSAMLLDIHLPGMDGYEVARHVRLREETTGEHLSIIAVTALASLEDRQRCFEAGVDEYVVKPIAVEDIQRIVGWVSGTVPLR